MAFSTYSAVHLKKSVGLRNVPNRVSLNPFKKLPCTAWPIQKSTLKLAYQRSKLYSKLSKRRVHFEKSIPTLTLFRSKFKNIKTRTHLHQYIPTTAHKCLSCIKKVRVSFPCVELHNLNALSFFSMYKIYPHLSLADCYVITVVVI